MSCSRTQNSASSESHFLGAWSRGYKTFSMLNSTEHKNYPAVGILTFISMINTSNDSLKERNTYLFQHFSFYEQLKFYAQFS